MPLRKLWEFLTSRFMHLRLLSLSIGRCVASAGRPHIRTGRSEHNQFHLLSVHPLSASRTSKKLHLCFQYFLQTQNWRHAKHFKKFWRPPEKRCRSCSLVPQISLATPEPNWPQPVHIPQKIHRESRSTTAFVNMRWEPRWSVWRFMVAFFQSEGPSLSLRTTCALLFA